MDHGPVHEAPRGAVWAACAMAYVIETSYRAIEFIRDQFTEPTAEEQKDE